MFQLTENQETNVPQEQEKKSKIPGFRSGKVWKKVVACAAYGFIALFIFALFSPSSDTGNKTPKPSETAAVNPLEESKNNYTKGVTAFEDQDWDNAEIALTKVVADDPNYADAQTKLKEIGIIQADKRLSEAKNILASDNLNEDSFDNAVYALNTAVKYNPDLTEAKELIPKVKQQKQQFIEQQKQQEIADYKNSCKTYEYKVLDKNPDSLIGEKVKLRGKIMQIQEDVSTFMLVEVTHKGYDIWTDTVAVAYLDTMDIYEDDKITFWGEVTGAFSYTSQAGWDITIPGVRAKYIEKG